MDSRRDFLKQAALLAAGGFTGSIERALAIDPAPGSTWLDAEHVVILMQENRSFDHCYGMLRGVRGFNDPRAVSLPNGNPVWLQSNQAGQTYAPFRLNIKDTKATWMGSLPHSWVDQTDARNGGRHDGWLDAKRSGNRAFAGSPLTLGYYDRSDLPYYYALADAFTICDQNFCSSLTGTTPNRLHLWTGTIRERPTDKAKANVRNEDVDFGSEASWTTFPERLEDAGISWRVYQNEISADSGLRGEADAWLANFTDNPLEWFTQYRVRFAAAHRRHLEEREQRLPGEIANLEAQSASKDRDAKLAAARAQLDAVRKERAEFTDAGLAALPARERNLHGRAFTNNSGDPDYRKLASLPYRDGDTERRMQVPKGDVLHQFREDVKGGRLPTVSWIVSPENFSDHPGAPWYGAWYLSECLDILTRNPDVWRKTIFILCYDENDGYFDHVPPFVPPDTAIPGSGKVSPGIDTTVEQVRMAQEDQRQESHPGSAKRAGPIGLGFRVPLVIASPWSRGGFVNSEVFDHTSILRMLETLQSHRSGRTIRESNISAWRRTVCGDLSSVFRPYRGEPVDLPVPVRRDAFLGSIHQAQFRPLPAGYRQLSPEDITLARTSPKAAPWLPRQEPGVRPSCALPYELAVDGSLAPDRQSFSIRFAAGNRQFGKRSAGAPFHVYAPGSMRREGDGAGRFEPGRTWSYAVNAGGELSDSWPLQSFEGGGYHLRIHGPNGFYREFRGDAFDPALEVAMESSPDRGAPDTGAVLTLRNAGRTGIEVRVRDLAYGNPENTVTVQPGQHLRVPVDLTRGQGWYDLSIQPAASAGFVRRYAGRIETGKDSVSDPLMGGTV